ncbi:MAG: PAS domain S-box protein [Proteobacteria bacterium]|nr:PAS domain S-box protein [Pseudomonadota bacterium]
MEKDKKIADSSELRRRAEKKLEETADSIEEISGMSPEKTSGFIHELQVHQIELEMQNEELRRIQGELERTRDRYSHLYDFAPVGYVTISEKGTILEANITGAAMLGVERTILIKKPFSHFITRDDQDFFYFYRKKLIETKEKQAFELRLVKKDGSEFYAQLDCSPVKDLQGDFNQLGILITDINDRKLAEEALRKAHDELEQKVEARTAELVVANKKYQKKIEKHKVSDRAFRESEEKYKSLFDGANDAIFLADTETGQILDANREAERLIGRTRKEIINMNRSQIHPPDKAEYYREHFRKHVEAGRIVDFDAEIIRKDGTIVPVSISASVIQLHGRKLIQGIFRDCTEQKRTEEEVRSLSQMLMKAQERERQMLSYELHDCVAQNLSVLKIDCDMLFVGQSNISSELIAKTAKLSKTIEQTISTVRNLSYDLQPPVLNQMGLVHALEIYCEEFSQNSGLKVDFQSAGIDQLNMDADTEIHLYRLVQEGLNNVRKHADAGLATVKLISASPNIILRIEDDGKGFDVKARELALDSGKRMGLRSMKERVNLLQGQMTIESRLNNGTKIFIRFPGKERKGES